MENFKESIVKFLRLDNLVGNLTGYLEAQVKLVKLEVKDEVAKILSRGLVIASVLMLAFLFLIFFSVGFAHYLSEAFNQPYMGYWIVSGIYGLPCVIFLIFRKPISAGIERYFADQIKNKEK